MSRLARLPEVSDRLPDTEEAAERFARAIEEVASAAKGLLDSRLTKRAIVVLLRDSMGTGAPSLRDIERVLDHASNLDSTFLKRAKKGPAI